MIMTPEGYVIVQVITRTASDDFEEIMKSMQFHKYLVSTRDGKGVYLGDDLMEIKAVSASRIVTGFSYPFPHIKVYRLIPKTT